jgi:hypothetical protein
MNAWLLAAMVVAGAPAEPPALSVSGYAAALDGLRADLEAGRLEEGRARARALSAREIVWAGQPLAPDPTILEAVEGVKTPGEARAEAARIRRLVDALEQSHPSGPVTTRRDALERLTHGPDLEKGGEAPRLRAKPLSFPEKVEAALLAVTDWLSEVVRSIGRWLGRLVPERARPGEENAGTTATVAVVFAAVVAALLVVLGLRALRREAVGLDGATSSPVVSSSRDEDPLSREASGWESYATELASKRRWREAIRAWYHAVLVTLFRSGLLHHQRGRTNWEYVAQLGPEVAWRGGFISLTRRFDREWYGRRTSSSEALSECARDARRILRAVSGAGEAP